jgi:flagellar biosynthesis protein FliQ
MDAPTVIELGREALWMALRLGGPALLTALAAGLIIGLLQALTQIQEQTIVFVPKLLAMILVLSLTLPWLIAQFTEYTTNLIQNIPGRF